MTALWAQEAAERFWANAAGAPDQLPRDLRRAIALTLPLAVVDLPRLRVATISAWLSRRGVALPIAEQDRPLRACLLVHRGAGVVFLDGADSEDERRLSLAHEVAHFLAEYLLPRKRALSRVGPEVLQVLDGQREPSHVERVDAILAGVLLRSWLHLMERTPGGHPFEGYVSAAERRADELSLELLAPVEAVRSRLPDGASRKQAEEMLSGVFGLPPAAARAYACQLVPDGEAPGSLVRSLFQQVER